MNVLSFNFWGTEFLIETSRTLGNTIEAKVYWYDEEMEIKRQTADFALVTNGSYGQILLMPFCQHLRCTRIKPKKTDDWKGRFYAECLSNKRHLINNKTRAKESNYSICHLVTGKPWTQWTGICWWRLTCRAWGKRLLFPAGDIY